MAGGPRLAGMTAVVVMYGGYCPAQGGAEGFRPGWCPADFVQRAQATVDRYRAQSGAPGVAVAFFDRGKECFFVSGDRGDERSSPVTPDTAFAMGSIEKVFNSALLAEAIAQGRVSIDDRVARYLTAADGSKVRRGAAFQKITFRNLVTHTSALPRKPPNSPRRIGMNLFRDRALEPFVVRFLNSWQPGYPPGVKYQYSNLGFVLAGQAAVELGGEPYTRLLAEDITGPLGMSRTGMLCQAPNPGSGCAIAHNVQGQPVRRKPVGLWTTARDMLRYVEANLGVLAPSPQLARVIEITHRELFRVDDDHGVGMGWEEWHRGKALLLSKDGVDSGFMSWVGFEPNRALGVAVLRNGGEEGGPNRNTASLGKRLLALAANVP